MGTRARKIVAATGILAAGLITMAGTASAEPHRGTVTAKADLDGNGIKDTVTLRVSGADTQELTATVNGKRYRTTVPGDGFFGKVQPIEVADVNYDGRADLVITEYVGANTNTFGIWDFATTTGLRQLRTQDGKPFTMYEGGGATSRLGYECLASPDGRSLDTLGALLDEPSDRGTFTGARQSYLVREGVAVPGTPRPFTSVRDDDPRMNTHPGSCR